MRATKRGGAALDRVARRPCRTARRSRRSARSRLRRGARSVTLERDRSELRCRRASGPRPRSAPGACAPTGASACATASAASRGLPKTSPSSTTSVSAAEHRPLGELAVLHPLPADLRLGSRDALDVVRARARHRCACSTTSRSRPIASRKQQRLELDAELPQQRLPPRTLRREIEQGSAHGGRGRVSAGLSRDGTDGRSAGCAHDTAARRAARGRGRAAASSPISATIASARALTSADKPSALPMTWKRFVAARLPSRKLRGELLRRPAVPRSSSATIR